MPLDLLNNQSTHAAYVVNTCNFLFQFPRHFMFSASSHFEFSILNFGFCNSLSQWHSTRLKLGWFGKPQRTLTVTDELRIGTWLASECSAFVIVAVVAGVVLTNVTMTSHSMIARDTDTSSAAFWLSDLIVTNLIHGNKSLPTAVELSIGRSPF